MTLKTVVVGALLVVSLLGTPGALADNDNEIGRYTIVPMPGNNAVILLDTKTGQNWLSGDVVEIGEFKVDDGEVKKTGAVKSLTWQPNPFAELATHSYRLRAGKFEPGPDIVYLPTPAPPP